MTHDRVWYFAKLHPPLFANLMQHFKKIPFAILPLYASVVYRVYRFGFFLSRKVICNFRAAAFWENYSWERDASKCTAFFPPPSKSSTKNYTLKLFGLLFLQKKGFLFFLSLLTFRKMVHNRKWSEKCSAYKVIHLGIKARSAVWEASNIRTTIKASLQQLLLFCCLKHGVEWSLVLRGNIWAYLNICIPLHH